MRKLKEKLIKTKYIYKGRIINLRCDEVKMPNGKVAGREVIEHRGAVAVVALTEKKEVLLVKQYRHPTRRELWEIPAGIPEKGENGIAAAKRELEEETGFKAQKVKELCWAYASPGYSSEIIKYYFAEGLAKTAQDLDEDELVVAHAFHFSKVLSMIKTGKIKDNKTILAILFVKEFVLRGS
ncbi:MAG: NUDIX hydrolase [Candidatus Saganbacteria bacterium]|nr:NUDIX hydrolase [Candidatus Saganbacteria bacterium]